MYRFAFLQKRAPQIEETRRFDEFSGGERSGRIRGKVILGKNTGNRHVSDAKKPGCPGFSCYAVTLEAADLLRICTEYRLLPDVHCYSANTTHRCLSMSLTHLDKMAHNQGREKSHSKHVLRVHSQNHQSFLISNKLINKLSWYLAGSYVAALCCAVLCCALTTSG